MEERLASFEEFWPFYVAQHLDPVNRALHFLGTSLALAALAATATLTPWWLLAVPLVGYGPAWVGHLFFEKNKPATFRHPLWSLRGDAAHVRAPVARPDGPGARARARALPARGLSAPRAS